MEGLYRKDRGQEQSPRLRRKRGFAADSNTAIAVQDMVARLIADVLAGRIPPRTAACLTPLLSLQLRGLVESKEIANLQRQLDELKNPSAEPEDPLDAETRALEITDDDLPIPKI